jgi:hypothetical protein
MEKCAFSYFTLSRLWAFLCPFSFCINSESTCSFLPKIQLGFNRDWVETVNEIGEFCYLSIKSSNPWAQDIFPVIRSSFIPLNKILLFFKNSSFKLLLHLYLKYFILLHTIVNGAVFLTSLSENLLLICRNITYPASLLNLFILVDSRIIYIQDYFICK